MRNRTLMTFAMALGLAAGAVAGCSSDSETGNSCSAPSDCNSGKACLDGTCTVLECEATSDCPGRGYACATADGDGAYSPDEVGFCTARMREADCEEGQVFFEGYCYEEGGSIPDCSSRTDCPSGQVCSGGACVNPSGSCTTDEDCAVPTSCNNGTCVEQGTLCGGTTCTSNQTCQNDVCVDNPPCNGACTDGQTCDTQTNTCVSDPGSFLCKTCTSSADCGGNGNSCLPANSGGFFCGIACNTSQDCPGGFICFAPSSDPGVVKQCVPPSGECTGCATTGCPTGQFCDTQAGGTCKPLRQACEACNTDSVCASGACGVVGSTPACLTDCSTNPGACGADETCTPQGGRSLCVKTSGQCTPQNCTLTAADCSGATPNFDAQNCRCVACSSDSQCDVANAEICTNSGACLRADRSKTCSTAADCAQYSLPYCTDGFCHECFVNAECGNSGVCRSGGCAQCNPPCGPNQLCSQSTLTCVDVGGGGSGSCTSDQECYDLAVQLGSPTPENATCDPTVGCYTAGSCADTGGGSVPLPLPIPIPGGGGGGGGDVFGAPCAGGNTCAAGNPLDIFGGLLGGGSSGPACACDATNPASCRDGETCTESTDFLSGTTTAKCTPSSGGGGGGGVPCIIPGMFPPGCT